MKKTLFSSIALATGLALMSLTPITAHAQTADSSVYDAMGAKDGIRKIVDDFLPIVLQDHRISAAFQHAKLDQLAAALTDQFCELTGGPCKYQGKDMEEAHRDMGVTTAQFNALAEDLQLALDKNHIPSSVQNKLIAKLAPMQRPIVTK